MSTGWFTQALADKYDYMSLGEASEIRLFPSFEQGEIVHARALADRPSLAATLTGVGELFYVLEGEGELWRRTGQVEDVTKLFAGRCVSIPPGLDYQYRALGESMEFLVTTMPRWTEDNWSKAKTRYWDESGEVISTGPLRPGPWITADLPQRYDYLAPDGSEIRLLPTYDAGGLAHARLPAGRVSAPVRHRTVVEIWYVLGGRGEVWRSSGADDEVVEGKSGIALTIPVGTSFQFRTIGKDALDILIGTFPRWPGPQEAEAVEGPWATTDADPSAT
jgi:mannose-6-phosphate isomerase-like protein (cupin superfamily)